MTNTIQSNMGQPKRPMKRIGRKAQDKYQISYTRERKYNILKYWRIVRYYIKRKYEISEADLEMLLFLYDEGRFTADQFKDYSNTMCWDRHRFFRLKNEGYINVWRKKNEVPNRKPIYELSRKALSLCNNLYKKLLDNEVISEDPRSNPIMKGSSYTDRVYRMAIKKLNRSRESQEDDESDHNF